MNLTNELLRHLGTISRVIHSLMDMKFQSYGLKRGQFIFDHICGNAWPLSDRPDWACQR